MDIFSNDAASRVDRDPDREYGDWARRQRIESATDTVALVILGTFEVERGIETLLRASISGPLSFNRLDLAAKIAIAAALGVVDQKFTSLLTALRKLRNVVAHPHEKDLIEAEVRKDDAAVLAVLKAVAVVEVRGIALGQLVNAHAFPDNLRYLYLHLPSLLSWLSPAQSFRPEPVEMSDAAEVMLRYQLGDQDWEQRYIGYTLPRPLHIPDALNHALAALAARRSGT